MRVQHTPIAPLRSVKIENFRGVRDLTLDLHPRVTVLFGANAAGKTSVLDAIAIALGAIVSKVPKAAGRDFAKSGDIRVPCADRADVGEKRLVEKPFARVQVTAAGDLRWGVARYRSAQDRREINGVGTKDLSNILDPLVQQALDASPDASELPPPIPLVAAYGTERAVVEVPLRQRDFQKEFHRLAALDQSLRATTRFKAVFEWFRVMEDEERREQKRRRDFDFRLPELEWVRRAVDRAELRCKNPRIETKPLRMLVDFDHGGGVIEPLDISSLSDGYRTHFSLVVDVARRMVQLNPSPDLEDESRGTNSEAIILIDEIDLHLHPTWQGSVVRGLQRAFPNAQLVLTTHSEQVIASVEASSVRKLVAEGGEVFVESVPFAQGSSGERILIDLMDVRERVDGAITRKLTEYLKLVSEGKGRHAEAKELRSELDVALPGDSQLHQADLEMQRQDIVAKYQRKDS